MWVRSATGLVKVFGRSAVVPSNRLPLRVAPAPGEAIDSWLEETARYMALPLRAVARALDLPVATRPTWIRWLSRDQLDVIQAATGVSTSVVEALTLKCQRRHRAAARPQLSPSRRTRRTIRVATPAASARRIRVPWTTRRNVGHSDLAVAKLLQRLENHLWATVEPEHLWWPTGRGETT